MAYYCFDRTQLFWLNTQFEQIIFAHDVRALLMLTYDELSRIFSCIIINT